MLTDKYFLLVKKNRNVSMTIKGLYIGLCLFFAINAQGQDLHFSQFYNSPLTTNPANTGFIPDGDYRLGANYRNQYSNIMQVPYTTLSAFADGKLLQDRLENGWVGVGGMILADKAGSGSLVSNKAYASVAYHQLLGYGSLLSAGFNLGYAEKRINASKLKFPDQFDGKFFDGTRATNVVLSDSKTAYFDMQVGLNYAYFPTENIYLNAGYSIHHVNKPRETFFNDKTAVGEIPMRQIAFANAILKVSSDIIINPNIYYTTQANSFEIVGGLRANYNLAANGETQLILGAYYRYKDAIIPVAGLVVKDYEFSFSYDATTSSLKNYNGGKGALEFSVIKKGVYRTGGERQTLCPKF